jgi:hypothetical protein
MNPVGGKSKRPALEGQVFQLIIGRRWAFMEEGASNVYTVYKNKEVCQGEKIVHSS